ncbi:MAG: peptidylprolyl isomerase [Alphaproteobacteria bacterium]|nr:peptidylprolyl isomerase [Alphaproteobacteria bacterium]
MAAKRWRLILHIALAGMSIPIGGAIAASPRVLQSTAVPPSFPQRQQHGQPPTQETYPQIRIAAVVNDDVISVADLASRVRMAMLSTAIPDTPEARKRLAAQVLRTLVDEKLEVQEAKHKNITATEDEINKATASVAQQNNMKPDQLFAVLQANGIEKSALVNQVTASIVWAKLIRQLASESDPVSDDEIDAALKRLKQNENAPEARVAEIFLPVDNPHQDDEVRSFAERLIEEMKKGARFSNVARQFSHSATAAVGGDIGWVHPDELSPPLAKAVAGMRAGELSPPIRVSAGYYLLLVLDRRGAGGATPEEDTLLHIVQVVFPLPSQAGEPARRAALAQAENVRSAAKSCEDMLRIGKAEAPQLSSQGDLRLDQIAPSMRATVLSLGIGQASPPIIQKNGIGVIMVCSKAQPKTGVPTREEVGESLMRERVDIMAQRYLRDLRRVAYVDVRV